MKLNAQMKKKGSNGGFTLIEILVVIGIIAVLAAVVLIAINPARQFAQARDSQRTANTNAILNAVGQHLADNAGLWNDADCDDLPAAGVVETISNEDGDLDIRDCLVPDYIPELPVDPAIGEACVDANDDGNCDAGYNTGYTIEITDSNRIRICTEDTAATEEVALERNEPICVTR